MIPELEAYLDARAWTLTGVPQEPKAVREEHQLRRSHWLAQSTQPKVSVLMALYNSDPGHLQEAVASIWHQSYPNIELILVDDASSSRAHIPIAQEMVSEGGPLQAGAVARVVQFISHSENLGISAARNTAFGASSGEYVCIVDHDDVVHPFAIDLLVEHLLASDVTFQYSFECKLKEDGFSLTQFLSKPYFSRYALFHYNYICHMTLIKRDMLLQLAQVDGILFQSGLDGAEDHDLFLRLSVLEDFRPGVVPFFLYYWRMSASSTALDSSNKPEAMSRTQAAAEAALTRSVKTVGFDTRPGQELFAHRTHLSLVIKKRWFRRGARVSLIFFGTRSPDSKAIDLWRSQRYVNVVSTRFIECASDGLVDYRSIDTQIRGLLDTETAVMLHSSIRPLQPESLYQLASWLHVFPDTGTVTGTLHDLNHFPDPSALAADAVWGLGGYRFKPKLGYGAFPRLEIRGDKSTFLFEAHEEVAPSALLMAIAPDQYHRMGGFRIQPFARRLADLDLGLRMLRVGFRHLNIGAGFFCGRDLPHFAFGDNAPEEAHLVGLVSQNFERSVFQLAYDHAHRAYYGED